MNPIYLDFLFSKGYLVGTEPEPENVVETLFSLAKLFGIQIVSGHAMACQQMIGVAQTNLGRHVPAAFYRGFPESVRQLAPDQLRLDQLLHYFKTYYLGATQASGHSAFPEDVRRALFDEETEIRCFKILSETDAVTQMGTYVAAMLDSTRPLSNYQYLLVLNYIRDYDYTVGSCPCKDTAVRLLLDTRKAAFAAHLKLSDVIRLVELLQYQVYNSTDVKKLNLRNQDRVFLAKVLDTIFQSGECDVRTCFEKKRIWNGFLHHIHYKPVNARAAEFVEEMRGKYNRSAYSVFEAKMNAGDIGGAAQTLLKYKGSGAVLRNLNYMLGRCQTDEEVAAVLKAARSQNKIIMLQLLVQYSNYRAAGSRTFKFVRFNRLKVHRETEEEMRRRRSEIPALTADRVCKQLRADLAEACKNKLGKVYVDETVIGVALPLQENTAMGGVGVLPKGTRRPIAPGKKIRAFTYWEKVDDIDLSVIGITEDERQIEFSWRTMYNNQSDAIAFSGDQISGYNGGSEFFDISLQAFRSAHPDVRYLVFCDNVYSCVPFSECLCKAGYMLRDQEDSGEIFEPKTVASSFRITCDSRFAYLFAIDLQRREFVWLNIGNDSWENVAGMSDVGFLLDYMNITRVMDLYDLAALMATERVEKPEDADIVFSDKELPIRDGAQQIRSCDCEKVLALLNN